MHVIRVGNMFVAFDDPVILVDRHAPGIAAVIHGIDELDYDRGPVNAKVNRIVDTPRRTHPGEVNILDAFVFYFGQ